MIKRWEVNLAVILGYDSKGTVAINVEKNFLMVHIFAGWF
jgi:hypothetical protein